MRPLRESLRGEPIHRVMGIVNGTTNYILTRMTEEGASYHDALAEAQRLGYAERDPTADVEGYDAGAKAAIIAMVAFGVRVVAGDVYHEGISRSRRPISRCARRLGYRIKLLAVAERFDGADRPEVAVRVHPAMVPETHPLAAVRDSFNAVFVEGGAAGDLMFYGRGAGGLPTASAVLGDVIDAANNLRRGVHGSMGVLARPRIRPDRRDAFGLLPVARRGGSARRARRGGDRVRQARRVDPFDGADRSRPTRPVLSSSRTSERTRCAGHAARPAQPRRGASRRVGAAGDRRMSEGLPDSATKRARSTRRAREALAHAPGSLGAFVQALRELEPHPLEYLSTVDAPALDFGATLLAGLATDGGLYVPDRWPALR